MADGAQLYSQQRLTEPFTAYILLTEPLQFRIAEILDALREDYPDLDWSEDRPIGDEIDTAKISLGVLWAREGASRAPSMITFLGSPGACDVD